MRANVAHDLVAFTLLEIRPILGAVRCSPFPLESNRFFLKSVRDKLHDTCKRFEDGTDAEDYGMFYIPLFDALSFLTDALHRTPICAVNFRRCLETVEALHDHTIAAPA